MKLRQKSATAYFEDVTMSDLKDEGKGCGLNCVSLLKHLKGREFQPAINFAWDLSRRKVFSAIPTLRNLREDL